MNPVEQREQEWQRNSTDLRHGVPHPDQDRFLRRVLAVVGISAVIILLGLFLWAVIYVLLLVFAGILLAIFLRSLSEWVNIYTPLGEGWSLAAVVLGLFVVLGASAWLLAPSVAEQIDHLTERIPRSIQQLEDRVRRYEWGRRLFAQAPQTQEVLPGAADIVQRAAGVFSSTVGTLASFVIFFFIGLFLASKPGLYTGGFLRLVPINKRDHACEILYATGYALRWWLIGQMVAMVVVAVLTTLGLWLLQVDLALTLGLLAGLLNFVPNLGPILAMVPAVLLALLQSPTQAVYVVLLYLAIQGIEGYVITPLIQQRTVSLPPALTITAQVALGVLLGIVGVAVATPLTVCLIVLIQILYVQDMLGDSIEVLGE